MERPLGQILGQGFLNLPGLGCFILDGASRYAAFNDHHARAVEILLGFAPAVGDAWSELRVRARVPKSAGRHQGSFHQRSAALECLSEAIGRARAGAEVDVMVPGLGPHGVQFRLRPLRSEEQQITGVVGSHELAPFAETTRPEGEMHRDWDEIGRLADGIINEINNLDLGLTAGQVDEVSTTDARIQDLLESALERGKLARRLAHTIRARARVEPPDEVEFSDVIETLRTSLRVPIDNRVGQARLRVDPDELSQALAELVRNAEEAGAQTISVVTFDDAHDDTWPRPRWPFVVLEVVDDGEGIPPERAARVFEPYVGSRPRAHGVGLTRARAIVEGHGGTISLHPNVPQGTRVRLRLPSAQPAENGVRSAAPPDQGTTSEAATLEVFVVDDAPEVRRVLGRVLRHAGHTVSEAEDGLDALEKLDASGRFPDVVVLDLLMPRLDGVETFRELRARAPTLPILVTSGYHPASIGFVSSDPYARFLAKPFLPGEVLESLQELLRSSR